MGTNTTVTVGGSGHTSNPLTVHDLQPGDWFYAFNDLTPRLRTRGGTAVFRKSGVRCYSFDAYDSVKIERIHTIDITLEVQ